MDAHPDYLSRVNEAYGKIREGHAILNEEHNRLMQITVSQQEALLYYKVTLPTLIKRRKENLIPSVRFGNHYRYFLPEKGVLCSK